MQSRHYDEVFFYIVVYQGLYVLYNQQIFLQTARIWWTLHSQTQL